MSERAGKTQSVACAQAWAFTFAVLFLVGWGAWFIYRTSFELDGKRYFCLFDDAMISMRYARQLVAGNGLNWAGFGDPVEGYTHPLWLGVMVLVHLLPLEDRFMSLPIQLFCLCVLTANLFALRLLLRRHFRWQVGLLGGGVLLLTATYYPLNHWSLQGTETGLQALLLVVALDLSLRLGEQPTAGLAWAYFGTVAAALHLRLDMIVSLVPTAIFLLSRGVFRLDRRTIWGPSVVFLLGTLLAYEAFRLLYFGAPLPNTYYLKMTGLPAQVRLHRGLVVFLDFIKPLLVLFVLAGLYVATLGRRNVQLRTVTMVVALAFAYSIYVGGDAWENQTFMSIGANRFESPVMPLFFLLLCAAAHGFQKRVALVPAAIRRASGVSFLALAFILANGLLFFPNSTVRRANFLVTRLPLHVEDNRWETNFALQINREFEAPLRIAVVKAGALPYFAAAHHFVDQLGYNEAVIARQAAKRTSPPYRVRDLTPGHIKWDLPYILRTYQPDLIWNPWGYGQHEQMRLLQDYVLIGPRHTFWARRSMLSGASERTKHVRLSWPK